MLNETESKYFTRKFVEVLGQIFKSGTKEVTLHIYSDGALIITPKIDSERKNTKLEANIVVYGK